MRKKRILKIEQKSPREVLTLLRTVCDEDGNSSIIKRHHGSVMTCQEVSEYKASFMEGNQVFELLDQDIPTLRSISQFFCCFCQ